MANRAFKVLNFSSHDKELLAMIIGQRLRQPQHKVPLPQLPPYAALASEEFLDRDVEAVALEWNAYYEAKNQPWEKYQLPEANPPDFESPQDHIVQLGQGNEAYPYLFQAPPQRCLLYTSDAADE